MPSNCPHCAFPPCPSCLGAGVCAFCNLKLDADDFDAPVSQVDLRQLMTSIGAHETWANQLILHRRVTRKTPISWRSGWWWLLWGWPLGLLVAMCFSLAPQIMAGRYLGLVAPVFLGSVMLAVHRYFTLIAQRAYRTRSVMKILALLATTDTAACLDCEAPMTVDAPGFHTCETCGVEHAISGPMDAQGPSFLLGRLAEAKRLGHEAAEQALVVHCSRWLLGASGGRAESSPARRLYFRPAVLAKLH